MNQAPRLALCLLFLLGPLGCSPSPAPPAKAGASAVPAPAGATAPAPSAERSQGAAQGAAVQSVSGRVLETMDASNYTYVRVKTASGEVWAASDRFAVAVGDTVTVPLETPMSNFHSPSLNRDFPIIYFASRISRGEGGGTAMPSAPPMAVGHGAPGAGAAVRGGEAASAPLPPVAGATPIAKVWAERKALNGKTVTVHGRVVKYNGGILDRNWIHIQDGTGRAADGSNDLLLTSAGTARVGDVITATGTVAIDKDFTAGYAYKVMLEKAVIR